MSYDLDLRNRQYINRENFLRKRLLGTTLTIILLLSPVLFYTGLAYFHQEIVKRFASLESEVVTLRRTAEPLMAITTELDYLETRRKLIDELRPRDNRWSTGLRLLHSAKPAEVDITTIEVSSGGEILIDGTGLNLQSPAQFRQNLAELPLFKQTELQITALDFNHSYTFQINAQLSKGDELNDGEKKAADQ